MFHRSRFFSSSFAVASFSSLAVPLVLSADPAKTPSLPRTKVVVALDWTPNTNHTGLYAAKAIGAYEKQGLEVAFVQPAQTTATALVATGQAQFGVSFTNDVINARAEKLPVRSVAAIIQRNTSCFAWRDSSGIRKVKDWEGKRYGGWGSPEEAAAVKYIMNKNGADFGKLKMVVSGVSDFIPTTERNADLMWIYMGWDGVRAKLEGVKFSTLCPRDVDPVFDSHSPLLIAGESLLAKSPDLAKRFLAATAEGYTLAAKDPARAAGLLLKEVPELDEKLVRASADFLAPEYIRNATAWGVQQEKVWARSIAWNRAQKLSSGTEAAPSYFTNAFLPNFK